MRVSVFGLGYVGCVTAACLARAGHEVVGVDVNARQGRDDQRRHARRSSSRASASCSREVVGAGRLRATHVDASEAVGRDRTSR